MNTALKIYFFTLGGAILLTSSSAWAGRFGGGGGARAGAPRGGAGHASARPAGPPRSGSVPFHRPAPASRPAQAARPAQTPRPSPGSRSGGGIAARPASSHSIHGPYGGSVGGNRAGGIAARTGGAATGYGAPALARADGAGSFNRRGAVGPSSFPGAGGAGQRHVWDTPRGGTVVAGGNRGPLGGQGGYVYTGPHGAVSIGGGIGGSISGPGSGDFAGGKAGHVTIGPHGNIHAGATQGAAIKGPGGGAIAGRHGEATVGPGGAAIHGSRGGIATGPAGRTVAAGSRGAAAVGPYGAIAGGGRAVAGRGPYGAAVGGTRFVAAADLRNQAARVRNNFGYYNSFTPAWYQRHPGAWYAVGWSSGAAWNTCSWNQCASYCGYAEETPAVYYNYGDNVTYQEGNVYYEGQQYATGVEYAEQAQQIAAVGQNAWPADNEQWQSLGILAMVKGDETSSNDIFQLALNKDGVVRGNYYNAVTDATTPVVGGLEKTTQRIAWMLEGQLETVYETGLYNLTQEETTMLVHFGDDHTEQFKLFRVEQPSESTPSEMQ